MQGGYLLVFTVNFSLSFSRERAYSASISPRLRRYSLRSCSCCVLTSTCASRILSCSDSWPRTSEQRDTCMDGFQHKKRHELVNLYPPALVALAWGSELIGWGKTASLILPAYKYITSQAYILHIEQTLNFEMYISLYYLTKWKKESMRSNRFLLPLIWVSYSARLPFSFLSFPCDVMVSFAGVALLLTCSQ